MFLLKFFVDGCKGRHDLFIFILIRIMGYFYGVYNGVQKNISYWIKISLTKQWSAVNIAISISAYIIRKHSIVEQLLSN